MQAGMGENSQTLPHRILFNIVDEKLLCKTFPAAGVRLCPDAGHGGASI
jgi:hypothetical protein